MLFPRFLVIFFDLPTNLCVQDIMAQKGDSMETNA
jgi:hypothetical protein